MIVDGKRLCLYDSGMAASCLWGQCSASPAISFDFCPEHLKTPRGILHMQERVESGLLFTIEEIEQEVQRRTALPEKDYHTSALEKMDKQLDEIIEWTEAAKETLDSIPSSDWYTTHRTAGEQTHGAVTTYERAMDRSAKVLREVSKMAISDKIVSLGKYQAEMMIRMMMQVLAGLELPNEKFAAARSHLLQLMVEEGNMSERLQDRVKGELETQNAT